MVGHGDHNDPVALQTENASRPVRLPILPHCIPDLGAREKQRLRALADRFLKETPDLDSTAAFGDGICPGYKSGPGLVIEDHSQITLFETLGDNLYSYRACIMAGDDDLVAVGVNRSPAFEDYCRNTLGFGSFDVISPRDIPGEHPLAIRCAQDSSFIKRVAKHAQDYDCYNVMPYMGTDGVWALAGRLAEAAGVPIQVSAPPPRLTRAVNDKIWFGRCVREALGADAQPESFTAYSLPALAKEVSILARRNATLVIKVPSSASSAGNVILDCSLFAGGSADEVLNALEDALRNASWRGEYPLQVAAWEAPILATPSAQLWVPRREEGDVIVEGVFDQVLAGPNSEFSGAAPTNLPEALQETLCEQAAMLGFVFQSLNYFGRCSLDSFVVDSPGDGARVHWLECNGRWGGTSIPMTVANRLIGDWKRVPLAIAERNAPLEKPWDFETFCHEFEEHLYTKGGPAVGAVVLSPSRIENGTGFELLVMGSDRDDVRRRIQALETRLLAQ